MELDGIAALVTGGAAGLGAATAVRLADRGARVAILDRDAEGGARVAESIGALFLHTDVTSAVSVKAAIEAAEQRYATARLLVNCAGIVALAPVIGEDGDPQPLEDFRRVLEVNLVGTFNVLSQFAARLGKADPIGEERGVIINTASIAADEGLPGQAAYGASKNGVVGLTLPIARELAHRLIRVVTISPGVFLTPMVAVLPQDLRQSLGAQIPHPSRLGQPDEYARLVEAIVANPMLNGTVIRIDGAQRLSP